MRPEYLTRHLDLINEDALKKKIIIVGAGAIGSFTALSLAKMGYSNITVYDDDIIEPENMNCQFYPVALIDEPKVTALHQMVHEFTGTSIDIYNEKVTENMMLQGDYLICAVDNMKVRKFLFEKCWATKFLIDPRMGAEYASMAVLAQDSKHKDVEAYTKTLHSDKDAVQERCTAKSTVYTSMMIAGQICKAVKDTSMGLDYVKTMDWSIATNQMWAWNQKGEQL